MSFIHFISLIFFAAFAVYAFLGVYIISLNINSLTRTLLFLICLSVSLWAFCYSVVNTAQDYGAALFWRRLASFGWGILFAFLIHLFIIMTENSSLLKHKWLYLLIYLPAAVNIYAFGISGSLSRNQYHLINTASGWINLPPITFWNFEYNLYYVSVSIFGLIMLIKWRNKLRLPEKKKQITMLIVSFFFTVILGTISDHLVNTLTSLVMPELAPVLSMIPILTIIYAVKRYGHMPFEYTPQAEPGKILNEARLDRFYRVLSIGFITGGLLSFVAQYFIFGLPMFRPIMFSAFLFLYGIILQIVHRIPIREDIREFIFFLLVSFSVPLVTLNFTDSAGITVWAFPFILIMLSVIYNKRRLMFLIGVSFFLTQIGLWIYSPRVTVHVEASDYLARIGIFTIMLVMAYYVNRVYVKRLEENEEQIRFQKMVSRISADFINSTEANLEDKINRMLKISGEYFQVDRTCLISLAENIRTFEWCNEGIEPASERIDRLNENDFPWWMEQISKNDVIYIPDTDLLPVQAQEEKELLKSYHIRSLLSVPVSCKGKVIGFLFFASVREVKAWSENNRELLKILDNILSDALAKVEAEKEIRYMAYYDALTGLPNHTLFRNRLEQAIHLARRSGTLIGVVFIDLDSFKSVNDTIGHLGGDEMLKQVSDRLSGCIRGQDTVARFGGDEFLIQFTQIGSIDDIKKVTEKIMRIFSKPLTIKNQEFFISASAGIAVFPHDGEDTETLIKNADLAMYSSKDNGKNQYTMCSSELKEDVLKKMKLTNSLYRALERNELVLYYQPQINIITQDIVGFEALLRWSHPEYGMIPPSVFIPLAEQTGLINPIGQWVLQTACRQNKKWQGMGFPPVHMSVNLSVEQFRNPNLISIISNALRESGLKSKYLELEITEGTAVKESDYILNVLEELKELGVSVAIDDFGTEYSSLSRLKTLPADRIKIDMLFVHSISQGCKDKAIAKSIIQMAQNLNLKVIAEGVESEEQFEFFNEQNCDEVQGYYFYKPMPAEEIDETIIKKYENA